MDKQVQFDVVMSCSGVLFHYGAGQRITLGVDINEETATDLLRAGHIVKVSEAPTVERATVSVMETADAKLPTGKPTRAARKAD